MKSKYLMIGAAVCAALFLFSGIMLCRQYADEKQSAEAFEQVAALVETEPAPTDTPQETEPLPELMAFEKYRAVQEQNSDFVGWLSIPGTNIDYPVMQTVDEPNFYLKRGFDKQYSDYGVPYVQENCDLVLSDNCVIYGHHMNNGTMFADLCKYESEGFYQEHKTIHFDTLSGFGEYEIVAVMNCSAHSARQCKQKDDDKRRPGGGAARPASFSLFPGNALERGGRDDRAACREIVEPLRFVAAGSKLAERKRRVRLNDDVSVPICDRDLLRTGRLYGQRRLVLAAVIE